MFELTSFEASTALPAFGLLLQCVAIFQCLRLIQLANRSNIVTWRVVLGVLLTSGLVQFAVIANWINISSNSIDIVAWMAVLSNAFALLITTAMRNTVVDLKTEKDVRHQLTKFDTRTGLPNRSSLMDELQTRLASEYSFGLAILSFNRFKQLYESVGETTGNNLLREMVERIKSMSNDAFISQVAANEFVLIFPWVDEAHTLAYCTNILKAQEPIYLVDGLSLYVDASIGVVSSPEHGNTASELLGRADVALERSKVALNRCHVYKPEFGSNALKRMQLVAELRQAIGEGGLSLMYQPIVEQHTQRIIGAEALVRWFKPDGTQVFPDQFIPLAEEERSVTDLTDWVLNQGLETLAVWQVEYPDLHLHVNLATADIQDRTCWSRIRAALERHNISPSTLVVEITEGAITEDPNTAIEVANEIADHGVGVAIDDFGTGFSSLQRLKVLPVEEIKIDRSFVMEMQNQKSDQAIVESTIHLAKNLNCRVTAEGVESIEVARLLESWGCEQLQGYYFGKPVSAEAFYALLREQRALERLHGDLPSEVKQDLSNRLRA
ncbi:MAG: EAL domain-containing protein [Gammaproteobacteria bacterium]|nr:EAL domain-containing protein [Gammaproteobacteria bacterium]